MKHGANLKIEELVRLYSAVYGFWPMEELERWQTSILHVVTWRGVGVPFAWDFSVTR